MGTTGEAGAVAGGGLGSRTRTQDPPAPGYEGKVPDLLLKKFKTREEDSETLDHDCNKILVESIIYNKKVTAELANNVILKNSQGGQGLGGDAVDDQKDDTEVVVCDGIVLSEPEMDLLSLGPGFMVVDALNMEEIRIESNATMMKIRWGRRKQGTEDMTGRQEDEELRDLSEEDLDLAEALEIEARDVLSQDHKSLDMRNKRATDMRGNRRVMMPGPGPPVVEAEFNTSTLYVPYTIGSRLKQEMQQADNNFVALLGGGKVRVVEKGGSVLSHMLGRSDPWATTRSCDDPSCETCKSKIWLQTQNKACKKDNTEMPQCLIQKTANHCTREWLQCTGVRVALVPDKGTRSTRTWLIEGT